MAESASSKELNALVEQLADNQKVDRRSFLKGVGAAGVATACIGLTRHATATEPYDGDCGVASGDPSPTAVTLWTRVPGAFRPSGQTSITVSVEVSRTQAFGSNDLIFQAGVATTSSQDWTVCIKAVGLSPFTTYYYRFSTDTGYRSVTGRTLTAPAAGADVSEIRFAFVSCQKYPEGYYNVYHTLAQDDVHFCLHLGDVIYESSGNTVREDDIGEVEPGSATTLKDYRDKYKLYLSDPDWREVRRLFPWIYTWDDHEVYNNYNGAAMTYEERLRQQAAYQVFREFIPLDPSVTLTILPSGIPILPIHRVFPFGGLLDLITIDGRQYREENPCSREYGTVGCQEIYDQNHTALGLEQREWLKEELSASSARWRVLANDVVMMEMKLYRPLSQVFTHMGDWLMVSPDGLIVNTDQWDGYPAERKDLLTHVRDAGIDNLVVVTGDIHNCFAGELYVDFNAKGALPVAVELVGGSVTSDGVAEGVNGADLTALGSSILRNTNPHIKFCDLYYHVYVKVTVTPAAVFSSYIAVDTILSQTYNSFELAAFRIDDGVPSLQKVATSRKRPSR